MSDNITSNVKPVQVTPQFPNPILPGANWADAFEIETHRDFGDMRSVAGQTIGSMPRWARGLLRVRNIVVAPFGLKIDGMNDLQGEVDSVGIFPILDETKDRIVLGFDDRHLDFRIIVDRSKGAQAFRLRATTLVNRHNALGRIYIAIITPFHRMIVRSVLKNAV
ncbi:DUF2867 domain-containing protein [uncultured Sulfitobacter sp.]|uniref:DUF2867 domain-containing protein n=1 Tax=uncultured Sulfitobacter sp. TaxID=191468 RepID=UPI0026171746|nr:DUF2867 domain-containing protein [uncultured Sulfitobacter sp.]